MRLLAMMIYGLTLSGIAFDAPGEGGAGGGAGGDGGASGDGKPAGGGGEGGDGGKPDAFAWFGDGLDDDAKAYLDAKKFGKPADLYKSLRGAEKLIRGDQISGPPDDPEKQAAWIKESGLAKRLGIPDAPDGYDVKPPEWGDDVKGMVAYDDQRHGRLLEAAHGLNLTPAQTKGVLDFYAKEIGSDAQNYATAAQADELAMTTGLKREWGESYDQNVQAALETAAEVGLDEAAVESLRVGKVVGSTALTKILHELALSRGNDPLKGGGRGGGGGMSQETAAAALKEFTTKNGEALTKHDHPEHASAFRRLQELKAAAGRGSRG